MVHDVLAALPWGIVLAFTIGPVFFVLLETGAIKGFRAAFVFDIGVVLADVFFILIAYYSTNKLLEKLKDDPGLFILGGVLLLLYGIISFIKNKKDYHKLQQEEQEDIEAISKKNYLELFLKGFILNFINIGVLGFWLGIIVIFGPKLEMNPNRIVTFFSTIIITYLLVDIIKIMLAKQLKNKLTKKRIYKIKKAISIVLMVFGVALIAQGLFPDQKEDIKNVIEEIRKN
ncbi:LysE family translocator [Leptobacterium sp. I13]|uniref:LysE family translocator n=1 Tax=Leptobacterium meishanense TaxID=3128904 RepID=UPI0030EB7081